MIKSQTPYTLMSDDNSGDRKASNGTIASVSNVNTSKGFFNSIPVNNGDKVVMAVASTSTQPKERLKAPNYRESLALPLTKSSVSPSDNGNEYQKMIIKGNGGLLNSIAQYFYVKKGTGNVGDFFKKQPQPPSVQQHIIDAPTTPAIGRFPVQSNGASN